MSETVFSSCQLSTEDSVSEFFSKFRCDIDVFRGTAGRFDYSSKMCQIGKTSVSRSTSLSGWTFEQKTEFDGVLLTVPNSGRLSWSTPKGKCESRQGAVFVIGPQRDLVLSTFSAQASYIRIFIQHEDIFQYLKSLTGQAPKAKVFFKNNNTDVLVGRFLTNLAETVLSASENIAIAEGPFLRHLKESLICFAIYNLENNYSQLVRSPDTAFVPTPHCIKSTIEYINSHYSEALTSTDLALQANVSIRGLQVGFKKYRNTTINNYIREVRLVNARKMIFDSSLCLSLKQIAYACGFSNYYLFCKYYALRFSEHPNDSLKFK